MFLYRAAALSVLIAAPAWSQERNPSTWGFVDVRFSTSQVDLVYAGLGYHGPFAMIGLVQNPRAGYTEALVGVGDRIVLHGSTQVIAVAESKATESWYTQLYYIPRFSFGDVVVSSTFELYLPNSRFGTTQLVLAPAMVLVPVVFGVSAGASYQAGFGRGRMPQAGIGPTVHVPVPRGAVELSLLAGLHAYSSEMRARFMIAY